MNWMVTAIAWIGTAILSIVHSPITQDIVKATTKALGDLPEGSASFALSLAIEASKLPDASSAEKFAYVYGHLKDTYPTLNESAVRWIIETTVVVVKDV